MTDPATMTARELDEACAVIAGWRRREGFPNSWGSPGPDQRWYVGLPFHPTTDWNAAMSLLDVVRGWLPTQQDRFAWNLSELTSTFGYGQQMTLLRILLGPENNRITPRIIAECVYAAHGAGGEG